jgi:hypothetical protein
MPQHACPPCRAFVAAALGLAAALGCESLRSDAPAPNPAIAARGTAPANAPKKPAANWLRVGPFMIYSDSPLDESDPLFRELERLPDQIQAELNLPPGPQLIHVYLFSDQDRYEAYMKDRYPTLPVRRAFFIAEQKRAGTADELQVFTWLGEHLRTDLRHELTHAVLNGVLKSVPLWLDEGLAGYFEQPPAHDGVNPAHVDALRRGPFQPDLARLEKIKDLRQMEKPEYREAWAWVHYCLRGDPKAKAALLAYLAALREKPDAGGLLPRLTDAVGDPEKALAEHLSRATVPAPVIPVGGRKH